MTKETYAQMKARLEAASSQFQSDNDRDCIDVWKLLSDFYEAGIVIRHQDKLLAMARERIASLFDEIKHGDSIHQQWLAAKINSHFGETLAALSEDAEVSDVNG